MRYRSWRELVREPQTERHLVHVYRDIGFLREAVAAWIMPPLENGGAAILMCTPTSAAAIRHDLDAIGFDTGDLERKGRLLPLDAETLISRFLEDDTPDAARFRAVLHDVVAQARSACPGAAPEVRAWGEMVNLLWQRGERAAARRIETLWNEVVHAERIRRLCSYHIDNLDPATHDGPLREICDGHSQLIPEQDYPRFELAVREALVDVLGEEQAALARYTLAKSRSVPAGMPPAQSVLVALHETEPELGRKLILATRRRILDD